MVTLFFEVIILLVIVVKYKIQEIREIKKMSLRDLAELSGVSHTHISNIEKGKKHPTIYTLGLLAYALEVDIEELYAVNYSLQQNFL